jgi:hypothetical protein
MAEPRALPAKLPWVVLKKANGAGEENPRLQERYARVLFFPHSAACPACAPYVQELANAAVGLSDWDGRTLVVVPAGEELEAAVLQEMARGLTVLLDRAGSASARARAEVPDGSAALLIADRFGDIWHGYDIGAGHALPDVRELEAWLRYLGTMCPE